MKLRRKIRLISPYRLLKHISKRTFGQKIKLFSNQFMYIKVIAYLKIQNMRLDYTMPIFILLFFSSCVHKKKTRIKLHNDNYIDSIYTFQKNKILQNQIELEDSLNKIENQIKNLKINNRNSYDKKFNHNRIKFLMERDRIVQQLHKIRKRSLAYDRHFLVEDINKCLNDTIQRNLFTNHQNCLNCNRKSEDLLWIHFKSPAYTWKNLMGREGSLSICEKCKIPVEFITERMN